MTLLAATHVVVELRRERDRHVDLLLAHTIVNDHDTAKLHLDISLGLAKAIGVVERMERQQQGRRVA